MTVAPVVHNLKTIGEHFLMEIVRNVIILRGEIVRCNVTEKVTWIVNFDSVAFVHKRNGRRRTARTALDHTGFSSESK